MDVNSDDGFYTDEEYIDSDEREISELKKRVEDLSDLAVGVPSRIISRMMQDWGRRRISRRRRPEKFGGIFFFVLTGRHSDPEKFQAVMELYEFQSSFEPVFECLNYSQMAHPLDPVGVGMLYRSQQVACLGSTIYLVGGLFGPGHDLTKSGSPVSSVWSCDVSKPRVRWELCPPMNFARLGHQVCAIGGSIYAIGRHFLSPLASPTRQCPFMEKFDPNTQQWTCLPDPPVEPDYCDLFTAAVPFANYILVGSRSQGTLWAYDVHSGVWLLDGPYHVHPELLFYAPMCPPLAVGMTLFWLIFATSLMVVCDLELGKTFVLDLEKAGVLPKTEGTIQYTISTRHKLLHTGDNQFCLLWPDLRIRAGNGYKCEGLNCSHFSIHPAADGASFEARLVDVQGCIIDRPSVLPHDAVIVYSSFCLFIYPSIHPHTHGAVLLDPKLVPPSPLPPLLRCAAVLLKHIGKMEREGGVRDPFRVFKSNVI